VPIWKVLVSPSQAGHAARMGKKRRILLAMLPVALLACFAWQMMKPREPFYEGKPLSVWLEGYFFPKIDGPEGWRKTNKVVQEIGTNAIPALLRMLQARDSALKVQLIALAQKQHIIKIRYIPDYIRIIEAARGLEALGARASNAVPVLIAMYDQNDPALSSLQQQIAGVLGCIGPTAKAAIPSLLRRARDPNNSVRLNAVFALSQIHADAESVVPALIESLSDSDALARANAADGLGNFGTAAKSAVPALVQSLNDTDRIAREHAEWALKKIDPEAAAKAGVK
jgi:HEAT repeat protein